MKRKTWSYSTGTKGDTVRIFEDRRGGRLRFDLSAYGMGRPLVYPPMRVRAEKNGALDPSEEAKAKQRAREKHASLTLHNPEGREALTVGSAFALFHHPKMKALPASRSALTHHTGSREFWERELGADTPWDDVAPAVVRAALLRLKDAGRVETAKKRLSNLHTLYVFLTEGMEYDLRDITRGRKKFLRQLNANYEARQPRLTPSQRKALIRELAGLSWRSRLFYTLLLDSGTRSVQARTATRSQWNDPRLRPTPSPAQAPHGWFLFTAVKGQLRHPSLLTSVQHAELVAVTTGPLAERESAWLEHGTDYALIPGGRLDRKGLMSVPISDKALRREFADILKAAGIPKAAGDWLGFHAIRRIWAEMVNARHGRSVTKGAGGWSDEETVDTYLPDYEPEHGSKARQLMEDER